MLDVERLFWLAVFFNMVLPLGLRFLLFVMFKPVARMK